MILTSLSLFLLIRFPTIILLRPGATPASGYNAVLAFSAIVFRLLESSGITGINNRYFQVYTAPLTPWHGQKTHSKSAKICGCRKMRFGGIKFRHQFSDAAFPVFFKFWMDFGIHFGCILEAYMFPRSQQKPFRFLVRFGMI